MTKTKVAPFYLGHGVVCLQCSCYVYLYICLWMDWDEIFRISLY